MCRITATKRIRSISSRCDRTVGQSTAGKSHTNCATSARSRTTRELISHDSLPVMPVADPSHITLAAACAAVCIWKKVISMPRRNWRGIRRMITVCRSRTNCLRWEPKHHSVSRKRAGITSIRRWWLLHPRGWMMVTAWAWWMCMPITRLARSLRVTCRWANMRRSTKRWNASMPCCIAAWSKGVSRL